MGWPLEAEMRWPWPASLRIATKGAKGLRGPARTQTWIIPGIGGTQRFAEVDRNPKRPGLYSGAATLFLISGQRAWLGFRKRSRGILIGAAIDWIGK